ncbi:MAG: PqqD family protein [Planctomycetota bacterium]|jgi:hypothetical protein
MIGLDSRVKRLSPLAWREIEGKAVIMTASDSKLHTLNEVASDIWKLMENEISVREIVGAILADYDVPQETAEKDVLTFLEKLADRKVISVEE